MLQKRHGNRAGQPRVLPHSRPKPQGPKKSRKAPGRNHPANQSQPIVGVTGPPTGGTYTLHWGSKRTRPIPYDATPQQVEAFLAEIMQPEPAPPQKPTLPVPAWVTQSIILVLASFLGCLAAIYLWATRLAPR